MPIVTWDHIHLRSPDPEATAAWLADILGGVIMRGPGRIDVKLGGANIFIAPVTAGGGVNTPPGKPPHGGRYFSAARRANDAGGAPIQDTGGGFTTEPTTTRPPGPSCLYLAHH